MTGAIMALTSRAILRAMVTGAVMSAPLLITPCGSSVPVGRITVLIFAGTTSLNSIQLMSLMSRVETVSEVCANVVRLENVNRESKSKSERNIAFSPEMMSSGLIVDEAVGFGKNKLCCFGINGMRKEIGGMNEREIETRLPLS